MGQLGCVFWTPGGDAVKQRNIRVWGAGRTGHRLVTSRVGVRVAVRGVGEG